MCNALSLLTDTNAAILHSTDYLYLLKTLAMIGYLSTTPEQVNSTVAAAMRLRARSDGADPLPRTFSLGEAASNVEGTDLMISQLEEECSTSQAAIDNLEFFKQAYPTLCGLIGQPQSWGFTDNDSIELVVSHGFYHSITFSTVEITVAGIGFAYKTWGATKVGQLVDYIHALNRA